MTTQPAQAAFLEYYGCPCENVRFTTSSELSDFEGYFTFGAGQCFGRAAGVTPARHAGERLPRAGTSSSASPGAPVLPFDSAEVVTSLREERYRGHGDSLMTRAASGSAAEAIYYLLRPMLPVGVRRHLQQIRLRGWDRIPFPRWPVDHSVEDLMRATMGLLLETGDEKRIPFVWFWPDGAPSCTMLTHDVEGQAGLDFCQSLLELDQRFGFKSSFQLIPEGPERAWEQAGALRSRGAELNLHDLNHDGRLYRNRRQFEERAKRINEYLRRYDCIGFRSGAMYRKQSWYDLFDFEFDMSVPNVAHLEPQRGGCCTVMPYFIGHVLELPLTTIQDYSLLFILCDYSIDLWRTQIAEVLRQNGLISLITHPDYLTGSRERDIYKRLLDHLVSLRDDRKTWVAFPSEINHWWRQRRQMTLTRRGSSWLVQGPGSERARVAYASLEEDRVVYSIGEDA